MPMAYIRLSFPGNTNHLPDRVSQSDKTFLFSKVDLLVFHSLRFDPIESGVVDFLSPE